jgi:hypothetical protein
VEGDQMRFCYICRKLGPSRCGCIFSLRGRVCLKTWWNSGCLGWRDLHGLSQINCQQAWWLH